MDANAQSQPLPPLQSGSGSRAVAPDVREAAMLESGGVPGTEGRRGSITSSESFLAMSEADQKARIELVKYLRGKPELLEGLGLRPDCTAREMIAVFSDCYSVLDTLHSAGCKKLDMTYLNQLVPRAVRSQPPDLLPSTFPWVCMCTLLWVAITGGIIAWMIIATAGYESGWTVGTCNVGQFSARRAVGKVSVDTCTAPTCDVNVLIRVPGRASQYVKKGWILPVEKNYREDRIELKGEPFRCCDSSRTLNCCSLFDHKHHKFCDSWGHRDDASGNACPDGNWKCLFKLAVLDKAVGEEVTELEVYDKPQLWPFLAAAGCTALAAILSALGKVLKRLLKRLENGVFVALGMHEMWSLRRSQLFGKNAPSSPIKHRKEAGDGPSAPPSLAPPPAPSLREMAADRGEEMQTFKFNEVSTKHPDLALAGPRRSLDLIAKEGTKDILPPQPEDYLHKGPVSANANNRVSISNDADFSDARRLLSKGAEESERSKGKQQRRGSTVSTTSNFSGELTEFTQGWQSEEFFPPMIDQKTKF